MWRIRLFTAVLVASIASMTVLLVVGAYVFAGAQETPYYWMNQMRGGGMSGMMGSSAASVQSPAFPFFGLAFIIMAGAIAIGVAGLTYYFVLPEIGPRSESGNPAAALRENPLGGNNSLSTPLSSVSKTLTKDERKIVSILSSHEGKHLQKHIRREAGLSRLKTHRIVARLVERGIVTTEKNGNTNQVLLADWLKN